MGYSVAAGQLPQHLLALGRANEVRLARAKLKREIKTFRRDVCDVITGPPPEALGMTVSEIICCLPRFGVHRTERLVKGICRPNLTLEHCGPYTKRRLCDELDDAIGRPPRIRNYAVLP